MRPSGYFNRDILFILDPGYEFVERRPRFEDFPFDRIAADNNAPGGVGIRITGVYKYAEKMRHIMQQRQRPLESGAVFHSYRIGSGRDGGSGIYFLHAFAGATLRGVVTGRWKIADGILYRVGKVLTVDMEFPDGIGRPFENTVECQFHLRSAWLLPRIASSESYGLRKLLSLRSNSPHNRANGQKTH